MGINEDEMPKAMGVSTMTIRKLILDEVPIANKLAEVLNTSCLFWLNIQSAVEFWEQRNSR